MKAFLLAAGQGTRLRPITDTLPKCLVPIRGVPMLEIWLDLCRRARITDVLLNLHTHAEAVRKTLKQSRSGVSIRISEEPELLGSAGTLLANRNWVAGDDCFWEFYAYVLTCTDLQSMLRAHSERKPLATLGVYHVPDPSRCGVVDLAEDGMVRSFIEKPAHPVSSLAFAGLMVATPALFDFIPEKRPSDLGFDVFPRLSGRMLAHPVSDYLIDVGTMANYHSAQLTWPGL